MEPLLLQQLRVRVDLEVIKVHSTLTKALGLVPHQQMV